MTNDFDAELAKAKKTLAGMWSVQNERANEKKAKKDPFRLDNMAGYSQKELDEFNSAWFAIVEADKLEPGGEYYDATLVGFALKVCGKETADRIRKFMRGYQANGQIMGRKDRSPYGFKPSPDDSTLCVPDDYEQETTREILDLRNEGLSLRKIAAEMDNRGFKRRGGKYWTRGGVPLIGRIIKSAGQDSGGS